jgi:O-antigen/teichoic acid export membrane protein
MLWGSMAAMSKVAFVAITQIALVPIYLTYWDRVTYGTWLAILAYQTILSTLDFGYQDYLEAEGLRVGRQEREYYRRLFWSCMPICAALGLSELIISFLLVKFGLQTKLLGTTELSQSGEALIIMTIQGTLWQSILGPLVRPLQALGYFAQMNWWSLALMAVSTASHVIAVRLGASLAGSALSYTISSLLIVAIQLVYMLRKLRELSLGPMFGDVREGLGALGRSLVLSLRSTVDQLRGTGVRLLLTPMIGASGLVTYSTTRTIVNGVTLFTTSITQPTAPELMRYVANKDKSRFSGLLVLSWFAVAGLVCPASICLQLLAPRFFLFWTRGKLPLDPLFFALSIVSVLGCAVGQPAFMVLRGRNLLKPQLILSLASASITLIGIVVLTRSFGIRGAATAISIAEWTLALGYLLVARTHVGSLDLGWRSRPPLLAAVAGIFASLSVLCIATSPQLCASSAGLGLAGSIACAALLLPEIDGTIAPRLIKPLIRLGKRWVG